MDKKDLKELEELGVLKRAVEELEAFASDHSLLSFKFDPSYTSDERRRIHMLVEKVKEIWRFDETLNVTPINESNDNTKHRKSPRNHKRIFMEEAVQRLRHCPF